MLEIHQKSKQKISIPARIGIEEPLPANRFNVNRLTACIRSREPDQYPRCAAGTGRLHGDHAKLDTRMARKGDGSDSI
jgi:hypothetical protein